MKIGDIFGGGGKKAKAAKEQYRGAGSGPIFGSGRTNYDTTIDNVAMQQAQGYKWVAPQPNAGGQIRSALTRQAVEQPAPAVAPASPGQGGIAVGGSGFMGQTPNGGSGFMGPDSRAPGIAVGLPAGQSPRPGPQRNPGQLMAGGRPQTILRGPNLTGPGLPPSRDPRERAIIAALMAK